MRAAPRVTEGLMRKRLFIMLVAMTVFVAAIGTVKFLQIKAAIAQGAAWQPPPEAVTTVVAREAEWPATLPAIGSVAAVNGVTVSADLPGIVDRISFQSGQRVRAGEVLVRLDSSQERAQLVTVEAQAHLSELNLERARQLLQQQVIAQAEFDRLSAEAKQSEARVGEIRATIERKTIRAPFAGVLGIRQIDLGQYLNSGDPVVPLQSMDPVLVNFSVPQNDLASLRPGAEVQVNVDSSASERASGRVTAINSVIDEATRNVRVQATFSNVRARLKPGMFVDVQIAVGAASHVIALPASAISYAPYGNSVFIVGPMKGPKGQSYRGVRQQFVKLGAGRGDQVAVLSGLHPGDEVVSSGVFKLRNGAAILVNNSVQPSNNPAPRPEDS
jgi:membrane fusion protein, multidrug efflux system